MHKIKKMDQNMIKKITALGERQRTHFDTSKISTKSNNVRWGCMEAMMKMFRGLKKIADSSTYDKICRAYFAMSSTAPFKVICVGISPYKNGILPHFASALAYSPGLCEGSTPSVQVLSQAMALYAVKLDRKFIISRPHVDPSVFPTQEVYVARFAEMLRMSYVCSVSGVLFVNCSPVITKTNSEECMAMSLFSEWLTDIAEIHTKNDYKFIIVSMGELPDETISDAVKSNQTMAENVRIIRCKNPAQTSRLSVHRKPKSDPITGSYNHTEKSVAKLSGEHLEFDTITKYIWYEYPETVVTRNLPFGALMMITQLLAKDVAQELGLKFLSSISDIHKDFSSITIMDVADQNFAIEEAVDETYTETDPDTYQEHNVVDDEDEDPFENVKVGPKGKGYDRERPQGEGDQRQKKSGPYGVTKNSQFAQLVDPTGKAVSQQSIVIDNIRKSSADMLTMWKQAMVQVGILNKSMKTHAAKHKASGLFNEDEVSQCHEIVTEYEVQMKTLMQKMELACAQVEGLPAAVEGDYGIYTKETQPTAPLMRREDGSTMRNGVYDIVFGNAKDNSASSRGTISINEGRDSQKTPTQTPRRSPSPSPPPVPSTTSTVETVSKQQAPMREWIVDYVNLLSAQNDMDEEVCMSMMKKRRTSLGNKSSISVMITFMKTMKRLGLAQEQLEDIASKFLDYVDFSNDTHLVQMMESVQSLKDLESIETFYKSMEEQE